MDDTQLIFQAKMGDRDAFEKLVHRYDRRVLSIALTYTNNSEDAKDVYQEVFYASTERCQNLGFGAAFRPGCTGS